MEKRGRNYILMHREIPVAQIRLDSETGEIRKIGEIYEVQHVPVGISVKNGKIDRSGLNAWWRGRGIPASRDAFYGILDTLHTKRKQNHESVYRHYINCCETHEVPGIREAVDQMMVLDYLILNEDRHQNNFGVIRDAKTLEYTGAAPVFDSGTSFWWDTPTVRIGNMQRVVCKPFKKYHDEQIKLVQSYDWLDITKLRGIEEEFREIVKDSEFIDEIRRDRLCLALKHRVELLQGRIDQSVKYMAVDDLSMDVREDVSYHAR